MTFANHIDSLRRYLRSTLRTFFYLRSVCSTNLLTRIYYGIFHSKLQYAITCWGGVYYNKIEPLLILQKYTIRKICNRHRLHHSFPLFSNLKILPLHHLYCYKVLKTFFMRSGNLNSRILDTYNLRGNLRNLANVPLFRTTAFRNFYTITSCRLFNKLPQFLRSLTPSSKFLKNLKVWLFETGYLTLESFMNVQV